MTIRTINIEGYRSIRDLSIELEQVNVITGANGCGKSNVYKAIYLLSQAAHGFFAQTLAQEGGIPSVLWAGNKRYDTRNADAIRLNLSIETDTFNYKLCAGIPIPVPGTMFFRDPEVKEEYIWFGHGLRPSNLYLERAGNSTFIYDEKQEKNIYPFNIAMSESVLAQLKEPHLYPELYSSAATLKNWRFYHGFRTDNNSLIRYPQVSVRTTILSNDGYDLAAALQTIIEIGDENKLYETIDKAFPGCELLISDPYNKARFELQLKMPGIIRPMEAYELSDGTLRYLCLVAALLSPRLPNLLVLNEPETSLHPELLYPLAELICYAGASSQIIITTHSQPLAANIAKHNATALVQLELTSKGTQLCKQ